MGNQENAVIISKLENVYEEIENNWTDDIGKYYLEWLGNTISTIKEISVRTEKIDQDALEIKNICNEIMNDNDGEIINVKKKVRRI